MNRPGRLLRPEEQHDQRAQNSKSSMFEKQQIGIKVQEHMRGEETSQVGRNLIIRAYVPCLVMCGLCVKGWKG